MATSLVPATREADPWRAGECKLFHDTGGGCVNRLAVALGVSIFVLATCSSASFVADITIVNGTDYPVHVDVSGRDQNGWLGLTVVAPQTSTTVGEVLDQGEVWIFRFAYVGEYEDEVEISRAELERQEWTVEVPESFEQRLRDLDVPPPP